MRIGLLNLPLDNNYGGNLQRYALITVLQNMGHDVEHICLVRRFLPSKMVFLKNFMKQMINHVLRGYPITIFIKLKEHKTYWRGITAISDFYNKYIPHTKYIYSYSDIDTTRYDAIIVGSDQVWRKSMVPYFGLDNFLLKFAPDNIKKIGYGISIGNYEEWSSDDIKRLIPIYNRLNALSVREKHSIQFLTGNGFKSPQPHLVLDPTFLLDCDCYNTLISMKRTENLTKNKIFAYILDETENIKAEIRKVANEKELGVFMQGLTNTISIEQWLRNIRDARYVITDSYHGVIFSIIYQKPFVFKGNVRRGNVRIESLFSLLGIDENKMDRIDFQNVNNIISKERESSLNFLYYSTSLNSF